MAVIVWELDLQLPIQSVRISTRARCTTLCDKVCQWLGTRRCFFPGPPVSPTNKTDLHDITEILLKVALNTTKQTNKLMTNIWVYDICIFVFIYTGVWLNVITKLMMIISPYFCARTWISNVICHDIFYIQELILELVVLFVGIGGMGDHHCINFILIKSKIYFCWMAILYTTDYNLYKQLNII